jgi:hypothetical protein
MDQLKPPDVLKMNENLSDNWRRWKQRFLLYIKAIGGDQKDGPTKAAILLHCIGDEALDVFNNFVFKPAVVAAEGVEAVAAESSEDMNDILKKFEEHCNPREDSVWRRHLFWESVQEEETIDQFVTVLKTKARGCGFDKGDQTEPMIRDRIVFGCPDPRLKERLLRESPTLTLARSIEICRSAEATKRQMKVMQNEGEKADKNVHTVRPKPPRTESPKRGRAPEGKTLDCPYCGFEHRKGACPAWKKECHRCRKKGHFKKMCRGGRTVHTVRYDSESDTEGGHELEQHELFMGAIVKIHGNTGVASMNKSWYSDLKLSGSEKVRFKLDTGAEANVLPARIYEKLRSKGTLVKT